MAEQWIMVRLPRMLADALREVIAAREEARVQGHHAHQDRDGEEALHQVVEMLLEQYHAHARRRRRSRASRRVRKGCS